MNWILRNILAFLAGGVAFHFTNLGLLTLMTKLIPPPEGYEMMNPDFNLLTPADFLVPFVAHSGGTFIGAFIVSKLAATWHRGWALIIGLLSFLGGLMVTFMFAVPVWYIVVDLVLAYFPFALLGYKLGHKNAGKS